MHKFATFEDSCPICGLGDSHKDFCTEKQRTDWYIKNETEYSESADGQVYVLTLRFQCGEYRYVGQTVNFLNRVYGYIYCNQPIAHPSKGARITIMDRSNKYELLSIDEVVNYTKPTGMKEDTFKMWLAYEERDKFMELIRNGEGPIGGR